MNNPAVPMSELWSLAWSAAEEIASEQSRQSLPVPVRTDGGTGVAFFFCPARAMPGMVQLAPPHLLIVLDSTTGAVTSLREVEPRDFGSSHEPDQLLGSFALPPDMSADSYLAARQELFRLLDVLAPAFAAAGRDAAVPAATARTWEATFRALAEPPLWPYYEAVGAAFFSWMRTAARGA